jgi:hypothetical protein
MCRVLCAIGVRLNNKRLEYDAQGVVFLTAVLYNMKYIKIAPCCLLRLNMGQAKGKDYPICVDIGKDK